MKQRFAVLGTGVLTVAAVAVGFFVFLAHSNAWQTDEPHGVEQEFPKIVVPENSRDLGILDPADKVRHVFIVKNEGAAPLKIHKAGTSCQCTVSMLPAKDIPPGMAGPIEIESKTEDITGPFSHTAGFLTNDPKHPRFELTIQGVVRRYVAADPPSIYQTGLKAGEPVELTATIFSEVWDAFSLENVKSSIEGLRWEFQPASRAKLDGLKARSGYMAVFRLPGHWAGAEFNGWVEADAVPTSNHDSNRPEKPRKISIALGGRKMPIRAVYGPQIDRYGIVHLGTLHPGQGARANLLLKISGAHRVIHVKEIDKSPEFLNVELAAETPELAAQGLYRLVVEVPRDAPPGSWVSPTTMGSLRIVTDHPEMPEIVHLRVSFSVLHAE